CCRGTGEEDDGRSDCDVEPDQAGGAGATERSRDRAEGNRGAEPDQERRPHRSRGAKAEGRDLTYRRRGLLSAALRGRLNSQRDGAEVWNGETHLPSF